MNIMLFIITIAMATSACYDLAGQTRNGWVNEVYYVKIDKSPKKTWSLMIDVISDIRLALYVVDDGRRVCSYLERTYDYKIVNNEIHVSVDFSEMIVKRTANKVYICIDGVSHEAINVVNLFRSYLKRYVKVYPYRKKMNRYIEILANNRFTDVSCTDRYICDIGEQYISVRNILQNNSERILDNEISAKTVLASKSSFVLITETDSGNEIYKLDPLSLEITNLSEAMPLSSKRPVKYDAVAVNPFSGVIYVYNHRKSGNALWAYNNTWVNQSDMLIDLPDSIRHIAFDSLSVIFVTKSKWKIINSHNYTYDIIEIDAEMFSHYSNILYSSGYEHMLISGLSSGAIYCNTKSKIFQALPLEFNNRFDNSYALPYINKLKARCPWITGFVEYRDYCPSCHDPLGVYTLPLFTITQDGGLMNPYIKMMSSWYSTPSKVVMKSGAEFRKYIPVDYIGETGSLGPFRFIATDLAGVLVYDSGTNSFYAIDRFSPRIVWVEDMHLCTLGYDTGMYYVMRIDLMYPDNERKVSYKYDSEFQQSDYDSAKMNIRLKQFENHSGGLRKVF